MNEFHLVYFYFLNEFKLKYSHIKFCGHYIAVTGRRNDLFINIFHLRDKIASVTIVKDDCSIVVASGIPGYDGHYDLNDPNSIKHVLKSIDSIVFEYTSS